MVIFIILKGCSIKELFIDNCLFVKKSKEIFFC